MLVTTLNKIKECKPCDDGWKRLLNHLGKKRADDEPLSFLTIIKSNGFDHALWCTRSAPEYDKQWRLFAVWCAREVQHLLSDKPSLDAINVSEKFANGLVTKKELEEAREEAMWVASHSASYAPKYAAWSAASYAASYAALTTSSYAADFSSRDSQKAQFIKIITDG